MQGWVMARPRRRTVKQDRVLEFLWAMTKMAPPDADLAALATAYIKAAGYGGLLDDGGASRRSRTLAPANRKVRNCQTDVRL